MKFETCIFSSFSSFNDEEMGASITIKETSLVITIMFSFATLRRKRSPTSIYHEQ